LLYELLILNILFGIFYFKYFKFETTSNLGSKVLRMMGCNTNTFN
jgi:hypothetical protein